MQFYKTIKILLCLLLIIPLLNIQNVSAATNYDHNTLMEYEGYGKALYESIVEQTTFVTGQYTDNKQYVSDSMDQIKDYANFWYNDFLDYNQTCTQGAQTLVNFDCIGDLVERGGAAFLTVGDWIKNLFSDYDDTQNGTTSLHGYASYFTLQDNLMIIRDGYLFETLNNIRRTMITFNPLFYYDNGVYKVYLSISFDLSGQAQTEPEIYTNEEQAIQRKDELITELNTASAVLNYLDAHGIPLVVYKDNNKITPDMIRPLNPISRDINNYLQQNPNPEVQVPTLKPQLVCPDGTKINMVVNGSTFLSQNGQVMQVNKDGTAQVSSQICNLNWQKPTVDYIDDKPAITDPDGNWLDLLTGELLQCMLTGDCKPSNKDDTEVEPLDNSLLEYVKNAYQYATNFLKTATDGLKSLANGAKDLTSLFGTFFSWLPTEMVVLMSSGLGIAVGLRLFRK